jgi:YD repeat-containing protein
MRLAQRSRRGSVATLTVLLIAQSSSNAYEPRSWTFRDVAQHHKPALLLAQSGTTATYAYDQAGRIAAILFSDGTCVANTYDAQGNKTSTTITKADTPEMSVWGSGVWGCFKWSP